MKPIMKNHSDIQTIVKKDSTGGFTIPQAPAENNQNYFQRNGVTSDLQKDELEILKQASFDGFEITRYELLTNG